MLEVTEDALARIKDAVARLKEESALLLRTRYISTTPPSDRMTDGSVDAVQYCAVVAGVRNVLRLLGSDGDEWMGMVPTHLTASYHSAQQMRGLIDAIGTAIENGALVTIRDLARAETGRALLSQSDELLQKGYFLAAGVVARAVAEEHLRAMCIRANVLPADRPTIGDLNQALYKNDVIDLPLMNRINTIGSIGNHCAHNKSPPLPKGDVAFLIGEVRNLLSRESSVSEGRV